MNSTVVSFDCDVIVATVPKHSATNANVRVTVGTTPTVRVNTVLTRNTLKSPNGVFNTPFASTCEAYCSV